MKTHKVVPHTADVRLWVESDSLEGLFTAALEGMSGLIKKGDRQKSPEQQIVERFEIQAPDTTALLIDFLSEVLTLSHAQNTVFTQVLFENLENNSLSARINGYKTDGFDDDIKAVTYHEAEIVKNTEGNFETMIVFDI